VSADRYNIRERAMIRRLRSTFEPLWSNCSGATALEYALIIAFISIMVVAWAATVGSTVCAFFTGVNNGF
jgi:Flp pilus assembly pilin Flp